MFIQTSKPKRNKTVFGTSYKFVNVAASKITGILTQGQGNRKYWITDIEKTIVDCFDLPEHCGGYAELLDKKSLKNFIRYAKQQINKKYNVFDPAGTDNGEFVNGWRLRLNISHEEILDICNKQY